MNYWVEEFDVQKIRVGSQVRFKPPSSRRGMYLLERNAGRKLEVTLHKVVHGQVIIVDKPTSVPLGGMTPPAFQVFVPLLRLQNADLSTVMFVEVKEIVEVCYDPEISLLPEGHWASLF